MPVNRKRAKRDNTGGIPGWFFTYLKNGGEPQPSDDGYDEFLDWYLIKGTKVAGVECDDCDTAKKRKICREKLGI